MGVTIRTSRGSASASTFNESFRVIMRLSVFWPNMQHPRHLIAEPTAGV